MSVGKDVSKALKDELRKSGDRGRLVDDVKTAVADDFDRKSVDDTFDYMEKTGQIYVIPSDDGDRAKLTAP